jgi:hypothetical protein
MIFGGGERTKNKSVYLRVEQKSGVGEAPDVGASVGCGCVDPVWCGRRGV